MTVSTSPRLILGSSSPRRKDLLAQIGIVPDVIIAADIDETPLPRELPEPYCLRMALEKNAALAAQFENDYLITADNIIAVGRRVVVKPEDRNDAEKILRLLSGRAHNVMTAVAVKAPGKPVIHRLNINRVKMKQLSEPEIIAFLDSNEWEGVAGGYRFQGLMQRHVISIKGTPSGIIGLPLYETMQMLVGSGYKIDTALIK